MKLTKKHFVSLILVSFFCFGQVLLANPGLINAASLIEQQEGFKTGSNDVQAAFGVTSSSNNKYDIRQVLARIIRIFFGMLGIIFLILVLLAGFKYMNAGGNEEKTKEALSQIQHATIGLLIMLAAFAITTFVERAALKATNDTVWGT